MQFSFHFYNYVGLCPCHKTLIKSSGGCVNVGVFSCVSVCLNGKQWKTKPAVYFQLVAVAQVALWVLGVMK